MLSISMQYKAEIDQAFAIHVEGAHRRASGRRLSDDPSGVFAPGEVIAPSMLTRMKHRSKVTGLRIDAFHFVVLVIVTGLAGEGEIV